MEHTKLDAREFEILRYVAHELTNEQIADKIYRSVGLVEKELKKICRKMGAVTRQGAVHNAWKRGIFTKENC